MNKFLASMLFGIISLMTVLSGSSQASEPANCTMIAGTGENSALMRQADGSCVSGYYRLVPDTQVKLAKSCTMDSTGDPVYFVSGAGECLSTTNAAGFTPNAKSVQAKPIQPHTVVTQKVASERHDYGTHPVLVVALLVVLTGFWFHSHKHTH